MPFPPDTQVMSPNLMHAYSAGVLAAKHWNQEVNDDTKGFMW